MNRPKENPVSEVRDEIAFEGNFITVIKRHFKDRNGQPAIWEMVKRKIYGPIVSIIAITEENEVILEKVYRLPYQDWILEFPAGLTDIKGETQEEAIKRELLEETGYQVDEVELILEGPFNQGLLNTNLVVYFATGAKKVAEQKLDFGEEVRVKLVPADEFVEYLGQANDMRVDMKLWAVVPFLQEKGLIKL